MRDDGPRTSQSPSRRRHPVSRTDPHAAERRPSLFRSGLALRLVLAAGLAAPLWLAILWATA
ncbi:hypothetical protein MTDSW087_01468 [Methylobacterium dankookense]|uniref:Uncharacterized protein n=1 Tax=Methylobacterium dankookense TaxID=560405 RepID=A0A564FV94_9HYPH|nr:hypothetical protein IFDJLNFL_2105 [Methylobacterium dankookense]VUF11784.1 hypothetical protein MTDSW087_01468 [Methylobacterium dankookense]